MMCSCEYVTRKHKAGAIAEVDGNYLLLSDVEPLIVGLTGEDSAAVVQAYIRQWATEILVYNEARDKADREIENKVEDYRHSLYVHAYEQKLVSQRMPTRVAADVIESFYQEHQDMFLLRESIVRGLLLVVPNDAPKLAQIRDLLKKTPLSDESLEELEKYAYQYATGYELFTEEWKTANQLLLSMPFEQNDLLKQLKNNAQIELQDTVSTYILQVTDKCLAGESMPLDYATEEIEKMILSRRQVEFIKKEREDLYNKALRQGRLWQE